LARYTNLAAGTLSKNNFKKMFWGKYFYLLKQASVVGHSSSAWQPTSTGSAVTQETHQEGSRQRSTNTVFIIYYSLGTYTDSFSSGMDVNKKNTSYCT
jgi:hypothetical protein